ncbi:indole-3-glycerol phosphate synthase TrpC [Halanaerobaculum tunisiense]
MILEEIVEYKQREVKQQKKEEPLSKLQAEIDQLATTRDFGSALKESGMSLIAEVKKASPSKGVIREEFQPVKIAQQYEKAGASALSVLTDQEFFQGQLDYLQQIKEEVKLPILRKDFIIDPYQIYQARAYGADAILLIAAILTKQQLEDYLELADELNLDVLLEVHNRQELQQALEVDAALIGINNRDLKVFEVDLATTLALQRLVPDEKIIVSESGIKDRSDIELLTKHNIDAALVGETLMSSADIAAKVRELLGQD